MIPSYHEIRPGKGIFRLVYSGNQPQRHKDTNVRVFVPLWLVPLIAMLLAQARPEPLLRIEAPPQLAAVRTRLESFDREGLADVGRLVGLPEAGGAIRVVLATESSDWARQVPPWIAGFAIDAPDLVVLFPARSPSYPHDSLDDVLRHEVAHVLIGRAAGGRPVPRWFNEGLAMAAEHGWRFEDQTQLLYQLVLGSRTSLDEINRLFDGDHANQTRAYALAGAFVRDTFKRHGSSVAAEILTRVKTGRAFADAFADVTGITPSAAESEFWQGQRIWSTWLPIVTSSATLWTAVTLLALFAIRRRRQKNAEIEKRWEEEGNGPELPS